MDTDYAGMSSKEIALTNSYNSRLEECQRLEKEVQSLRAYSEVDRIKITKLERTVRHLEQDLAEVEGELSNTDAAYRHRLAERDELLRENSILRKKLGCKSCPPGEECYCKPIGGYDGK